MSRVTLVDNSEDMEPLGDFGSFRALYRRALKRSGLSEAALSRALGYKNSGFVNQVLNGKDQLPVERLREWLTPLALSDAETALLFRKGLEEYAPTYVKELVINFQIAYVSILQGHTMPPLDLILIGKMKRLS